MTRRLLINWVYYLPAGHVVEALQHAHGYHVANPEVEISLLLNAEAGARLLLERRLTFRDACRLHIDKLRAAGYNLAEFGYFG